MEKRWTWLAILLVALFAFAGCSDDDDPVVVIPEDTAFEVMAAAGAAYINDAADCPGVVTGADLGIVGNEDEFTIIDIRGEGDYLAGHIPGAFHSSLGTLVDDLLYLPNDKPYVLVCYSGQSVGHAKIAMELLGYEDVKSLKWGMCGWSTETDGSWEGNVADNLDPVETASNNADLTVHPWPVLDEPNGTVVVDRVKAMLAGGFKGISYINGNDPSAQLMGHEEDYFILNYFGETDYLGTNEASGVPGHIPGAFQFTPYASLGIDQMLENLPTDMPIVVYCWTGQHSSQITAYLNMLGYEAYSLKFGSNNLFHSDLLTKFWTIGGAPDNALVEGPVALPAYEALVDELSAYFMSDSCPGVLNASSVSGNEEDYTIIDTRSAEHFAEGHILGAYNCSVADLLGQISDGTIPVDLPIVVTCYTGQGAGYAKAALEFMDLSVDVFSLKFGMSSWSYSLTTKWDTAVGLSPQVVPDQTPENDGLGWNMYPVLEENDASTIVADRMSVVMAEGLSGVAYSSIADNLDDYFIINYWGEADYLGSVGANAPGHIPGAYQFTPKTSLDFETMLANLPSKLEDDPIVVYCWTGQTSAQITMYLRMLGYDAYSLYYGANTLFYSELDYGKWPVGGILDNDLYDNDGVLIP